MNGDITNFQLSTRWLLCIKYNYFNFADYLSDISKTGDHVIVFHAQEMPTLPAAPYPCESKSFLEKLCMHALYLYFDKGLNLTNGSFLRPATCTAVYMLVQPG